MKRLGEAGAALQGTLSDASGRRISPASFTVLPNVSESMQPQLVGAGDSFALFWQPAPGVLHLADLDRDGRATRERIVTFPEKAYLAGKIVWNGRRFLVPFQIYSGGHVPEALLLDRDGTVLHNITFHQLSWIQYDAVVENDTFVVATSGQTGVYAYRVHDDGRVIRWLVDVPTRGVALTPGRIIASPGPNGTLVVVSWIGPVSQLRAFTFTSANKATDVRVIAEHTVIGDPRGLLRDGDGFVLAAQQYTPGAYALRTLRLDAGGNVTAEVSASELPTGGEVRTATNGEILFVVLSRGWSLDSLVIGRDALPRDAEPLTLGPAEQDQPAIAAGDGRFVAAWSERAGAGALVRSAVVTHDGIPAPRAALSASALAARELAWSGTDYLGIHIAPGKLLATRFDANGAAIDLEPILVAEYDASYGAPVPQPAVTWTGTQWLFAWAEKDRIVGALVSPAGIASLPRIIAVGRTPETGYLRRMDAVAIASDGTRLILVWNETHDPNCSILCVGPGPKTYATRLTPDAEVVDAAAVELPAGNEHAIATSGDEIVVVSGITASLLHASGNALRLARSRVLPGIRGRSDVTWDGRAYLVAVRYRDDGWYLRLHRLGRSLDDAGAVSGIRTRAAERVLSPSIAALNRRDVLIAIQEGDAETGLRAIVHRADELAPIETIKP
ncbi:MAG TPA: hypothetical protein VHK90_02995 [Thermoanaerobaculia bacterium]|nr:hypothetical protein [Thermoanaerobaculia bacterium]